jgi:protein SSD1
MSDQVNATQNASKKDEKKPQSGGGGQGGAGNRGPRRNSTKQPGGGGGGGGGPNSRPSSSASNKKSATANDSGSEATKKDNHSRGTSRGRGGGGGRGRGGSNRKPSRQEKAGSQTTDGVNVNELSASVGIAAPAPSQATEGSDALSSLQRVINDLKTTPPTQATPIAQSNSFGGSLTNPASQPVISNLPVNAPPFQPGAG